MVVVKAFKLAVLGTVTAVQAAPVQEYAFLLPQDAKVLAELEIFSDDVAPSLVQYALAMFAAERFPTLKWFVWIAQAVSVYSLAV